MSSYGLTASGASCPLALVPAKVSSPERQLSFGPSRGNRAISSPVFVSDPQAFRLCNLFLFGFEATERSKGRPQNVTSCGTGEMVSFREQQHLVTRVCRRPVRRRTGRTGADNNVIVGLHVLLLPSVPTLSTQALYPKW